MAQQEEFDCVDSPTVKEMTYFGFLAIFLIAPILIFASLAVYDHRRGKSLPAVISNWRGWFIIGAHCFIALAYTTIWDNYLVATGVWWYDPGLVTGIVIGYVPIEEYTFFLLQPILTGLILLASYRYIPVNPAALHNLRFRVVTVLIIGAIWLASAALLAFGPKDGTYLGLLLIWALPPVILQLAVGADILWQHKKHVLSVIVLMTAYLSAADFLAIQSGTWTIDPVQSFKIYLGGVLPIEEVIFFMMTNVLVVFGITLGQSATMLSRIQSWGLLRNFRSVTPETVQ